MKKELINMSFDEALNMIKRGEAVELSENEVNTLMEVIKDGDAKKSIFDIVMDVHSRLPETEGARERDKRLGYSEWLKKIREKRQAIINYLKEKVENDLELAELKRKDEDYLKELELDRKGLNVDDIDITEEWTNATKEVKELFNKKVRKIADRVNGIFGHWHETNIQYFWRGSNIKDFLKFLEDGTKSEWILELESELATKKALARAKRKENSNLFATKRYLRDINISHFLKSVSRSTKEAFYNIMGSTDLFRKEGRIDVWKEKMIERTKMEEFLSLIDIIKKELEDGAEEREAARKRAEAFKERQIEEQNRAWKMKREREVTNKRAENILNSSKGDKYIAFWVLKDLVLGEKNWKTTISESERFFGKDFANWFQENLIQAEGLDNVNQFLNSVQKLQKETIKRGFDLILSEDLNLQQLDAFKFKVLNQQKERVA